MWAPQKNEANMEKKIEKKKIFCEMSTVMSLFLCTTELNGSAEPSVKSGRTPEPQKNVILT